MHMSEPRHNKKNDCRLSRTQVINIYKRECQLDRKKYQRHGQKEQHVGRKGLCDGPEN